MSQLSGKLNVALEPEAAMRRMATRKQKPTKFALPINLKTAKALGLTIENRCACARTRLSSDRAADVRFRHRAQRIYLAFIALTDNNAAPGSLLPWKRESASRSRIRRGKRFSIDPHVSS
jgi:hypothetical protein